MTAGARGRGGWVADQRQQRAFARAEFFFDDFRSEGVAKRGEVRGFTCRGTRVSLSSHLAGFDDGRCCCAGNTSGRGRTGGEGRGGGGGQERKGIRVALRWKEAGDATRCGTNQGEREEAREREREGGWRACMHFFSTPRVLIPESFKMAAGAESANDCLNR